MGGDGDEGHADDGGKGPGEHTAGRAKPLGGNPAVADAEEDEHGAGEEREVKDIERGYQKVFSRTDSLHGVSFCYHGTAGTSPAVCPLYRGRVTGWWSRGESNPCPKQASSTAFYMVRVSFT